MKTVEINGVEFLRIIVENDSCTQHNVPNCHFRSVRCSDFRQYCTPSAGANEPAVLVTPQNYVDFIANRMTS